MERNIIEVAELIEFLATCNDNKRKAEKIKHDRNNGLITDSEALELAIYYCI